MMRTYFLKCASLRCPIAQRECKNETMSPEKFFKRSGKCPAEPGQCGGNAEGHRTLEEGDPWQPQRPEGSTKSARPTVTPAAPKGSQAGCPKPSWVGSAGKGGTAGHLPWNLRPGPMDGRDLPRTDLLVSHPSKSPSFVSGIRQCTRVSCHLGKTPSTDAFWCFSLKSVCRCVKALLNQVLRFEFVPNVFNC